MTMSPLETPIPVIVPSRAATMSFSIHRRGCRAWVRRPWFHLREGSLELQELRQEQERQRVRVRVQQRELRLQALRVRMRRSLPRQHHM